MSQAFSEKFSNRFGSVANNCLRCNCETAACSFCNAFQAADSVRLDIILPSLKSRRMFHPAAAARQMLCGHGGTGAKGTHWFVPDRASVSRSARARQADVWVYGKPHCALRIHWIHWDHEPTWIAPPCSGSRLQADRPKPGLQTHGSWRGLLTPCAHGDHEPV